MLCSHAAGVAAALVQPARRSASYQVMETATHPSRSLGALYRPFLLVAVFAFFAGFSAMLVMSFSDGAAVRGPALIQAESVAARSDPAIEPVPRSAARASNWTFEKHI